MGDNIEAADDDPVQITPIWMIIIKWILVVINCMWIFADSIAIIMGRNVTKKVDESDLPESDLTLRILASIELVISIIGLIGLIGEKFLILGFHVIANTIYYTITFIQDITEMFFFIFIWISLTALYCYQIQFGRYRGVRGRAVRS